MPDISRNQIAAALTEVIRKRLSEGQEARVPGLGTFRVHHQSSQVAEGGEGKIQVTPPCDVVVFSADA